MAPHKRKSTKRPSGFSVTDLDGNPIEPATVRAFGHRFSNLLPGLAEDLVTLEREGALYGHFWDNRTKSFGFYRIRHLPAELFQYVEAHVAMQQFGEGIRKGGSFESGLKAIQDQEIAHRVVSYDDYGKSKTRDGHTVDIRGCFASFLPRELELVVCGAKKDRRELLPVYSGPQDRFAFVVQLLNNFPVVARILAERGHGRPSLAATSEYDVQDILHACLRAAFDDVKREEWTIQHAGGAKRVDLVLPSIKTLIEVKFVRSANHAHRLADELKVDIESYHAHPACETLFALVFDPKGFIADPTALEKDLSGPRAKGRRKFDVQVLIRK